MAYRGDHRSQYDPGASTRLRRMGCTPTSTANALRCATGGRIDLSGDQVLAEVAIAEESHPLTPGWSLEDAQLAVSRIAGAPPMQIHSGYWSDVLALLAAGYGVIQQGDSDQFLTGCSGTFDGDHCVFIHPDQLGPMQWLADPICPDWRLEWPLTLEHYAVKLFGLRLRYGVITAIIPPDDSTPPDTGTPEMGRPFEITSDQQGTITTDVPGGTPTYIDTFTGKREPLPPGISKRVYALTRWSDTGVGGFLIGLGAAIVEDDGQQTWAPDAPDATATPLAPGLYRVG